MKSPSVAALASSSSSAAPPVVYTIAGSDSGGGAGIQADLHAIHAMGGHGCSAITCLTAQNSVGVSEVHTPPAEFLTTQLKTLNEDMPPRAIKIGMLGTKELAEAVGSFVKEQSKRKDRPFVVLDPVMISTSGHKLIDDETKQAMMDLIFPYIDVLTPNKFEAEALLDRQLLNPKDVEQGARDILAMGVKAVIIKGGHTLKDSSSPAEGTFEDVEATLRYAQDYFLSSRPSEVEEERVCDGHLGVWLKTERYDSEHTHGTGCTLSSAMACALALGHAARQGCNDESGGATRAIYPVDACCIAKAYVTKGIECGGGIGQGPGPVIHTEFPSSYRHFPSIVMDSTIVDSDLVPFRPMRAWNKDDASSLGRMLPIVDTVEWVKRLACTKGVTDIQLRFKDTKEPSQILQRVEICQEMCRSAGVRLWINDHWDAACQVGCFGVHLGQEDLYKCIQQGGLERLKSKKVALGISTHSYGELAVALGIKPSYISMGPVFGTASKNVAFDPQGLEMVTKWRQLIPPEIPFVAIGGIGNAETAALVKRAGADCIAVIGAVTQETDDVTVAVADLNGAMSE